MVLERISHGDQMKKCKAGSLVKYCVERCEDDSRTNEYWLGVILAVRDDYYNVVWCDAPHIIAFVTFNNMDFEVLT